MKISPARKSAFEILLQIEKKNAFSSILLPIYEEKLEKKDRSLCREISLGVLRKKLYLDEIVKKFTNKNIEKFDLEVLIALRIGLYQILFLERIPDYSAINESVNLVKLAKKKSASGLVNAVLRKVTVREVELKPSDEVDRISVETSHPKWLIGKWIERFGIEDVRKLADINNRKPELAFRFTKKFYDKTEEERRSISQRLKSISEPSGFVENALVAKKMSEGLRRIAQEGLIYFQGEGSQLIGEAVKLRNGESFFDSCASPGSKVTQVAGRLDGENYLFAGDVHSHRMKTLRNNCDNQRAEFINLLQYDATREFPFAETSFDVVLVDAPCSGTGTIRKNPEIRYRLKQSDFLSLHKKQLAILNNASKVVKKSGRIIYSTCSLEVEENEDVVEDFLRENRGFVKVTPNLETHFITAKNYGVITPQKDNSDGFFIAVLQRGVS